MRIPVNIRIKTSHTAPQDDAFKPQSEITEDKYLGFLKKTGDMIQLEYVENEKTGFGGTKTTVSLCPDYVSVNRFGPLNTHMVFEPGKTHECIYDAGGNLTMQLCIKTHSLSDNICEEGGKLKIDYSVEIVGNLAESSVMELSVFPAAGAITS